MCVSRKSSGDRARCNHRETLDENHGKMEELRRKKPLTGDWRATGQEGTTTAVYGQLSRQVGHQEWH